MTGAKQPTQINKFKDSGVRSSEDLFQDGVTVPYSKRDMCWIGPGCTKIYQRKDALRWLEKLCRLRGE